MEELCKSLVDGEQDSDESSAGECNENRRPSRTASKFCGEDGVYYFGDAHEIDKLLSVEAYHESLPTISLQELHASAVQHPRFPNMRWLLHSRRVPLKEDTRQPRVDVAADAADESLSSALWQRYEHVPQSKRLDIQAWLELDGAPFPEASESVSTGLLALLRELDSVLGLPFFLQAEAVRLSHLVQGDHVDDIVAVILNAEENCLLEDTVVCEGDLSYVASLITHCLSAGAIAVMTPGEWRSVISPPSFRAEGNDPCRLFPCSGIGDADKVALICKDCRDCLCSDAPEMPELALANIMWGGREHPLYQNLSVAMKMLLSRGRPYFRKLVLGKGDPSEMSAGLVGNTILLAQPTTGEIYEQLPPPRESFGENISILFATSRSDVTKAKPLQVCRDLYLRCAEVRASACYAFADVHISRTAAEALLPENGVPHAFVEDATHMKDAVFFEPTMDGPAKMRDPGSKGLETMEGEVENVESEAEDGGHQQPNDPATDSTQMGQEASQFKNDLIDESDLGSMTEDLIGFDESMAGDPLSELVVLQSRLRALRREGDKLVQNQMRAHTKKERLPEDSVALIGQTEQCRQHFISLQEVARKMCSAKDVMTAKDHEDAGHAVRNRVLRHDPETDQNSYSNRAAVESAMEFAMHGQRERSNIPHGINNLLVAEQTVASAPSSVGAVAADNANSVSAPLRAHIPARERGVVVQAGSALSMFESLSWVYSFVEFFHGDCVPRHPARAKEEKGYKAISFEKIFRALLLREELEYSLPSDTQQYRARPMSRWDNPTMVMVFASTLRSLLMLQASKLNVLRGSEASSFHQDLKVIAESSAEDFEAALSFAQHKGAQSLIQAFQCPTSSKNHKAVHTALKHTLMQTAIVPLTEGNKMKLRHRGFSLSLCFGSLKVFLTTNFADTYSPITLLLYNCGEASELPSGNDTTVEPSSTVGHLVGGATLNLFEDNPVMPTLQRMHQIVARHPCIQARLFLLMEELTITELLCAHGASIGTTSLHSSDARLSLYDVEDDYASDGSPGLANFITSLIEPLEAQGRGFAHGHKKVSGVPNVRAAQLKAMFRRSDDSLAKFMAKMRDEVLRAASTLQYDSATVLAEQLNVEVLPEPFSKKQQMQSRLDGCLEMDGTTTRSHMEVTPAEPQGHVVREKTLAEAQQRSCRNPYKCVPLTGCHQSMLPCYRSSAAIGHLANCQLDDYGLRPESAKLESLHANWDEADDGQVLGVLDEHGQPLETDALEEDAHQWATSYARHVRSNFGRNHDHTCSKTCTKYAHDDKNTGSMARRAQAFVCRFLFFTVVVLVIVGEFKDSVKRILRRGKQLVASAFIASTNERNEYGRTVLLRTHPFTSSSSDLLQSALECNADYQFQDRAVPPFLNEVSDTLAGLTPNIEQDCGDNGKILYGVGELTLFKSSVMFAYKAGMKAGFVCDFYMTKYQSKAQQILSAALGPLVQGLRRIEAEEAELDVVPPIRERALKKLRRLMFAANKSHWYSAAELAIFVLTGGHCIETHGDTVLFTSRAHFMFEECKRLFNNESGRAEPHSKGSSAPVENVDMLQVSAATHTEHSKAADVDTRAQTDTHAELHVFKSTTTSRDDWLHRGPDLAGLDWYQYCKHVERVKMPKDVSRTPPTQRYFPFDDHYSLSKQYCQILRRHCWIVPRTVGPQCQQQHVDNGEANALYKAILFTPLRCMGPDHCADVQQCRHALFADPKGRFTFRQGWRARRAQIEVLADSAQAKLDREQRIPVIKDTTTFKDWEVQTPDDGANAQLRRKNVGLRDIVRQLIFRAADAAPLEQMHVNSEQPICYVLEYLNVHSGRHPDQMFLAEFAAVKAREILFNVDMDVEARNTVVVHATKMANCVVENDSEPEDDAQKMELEDVGGSWCDDADNETGDDGQNHTIAAADKIYDWSLIKAFLCKDAEIKATQKPGKHADAHKNMRNYSMIFGPSMWHFGDARELRQTRNLHFGADVGMVLAVQQERAKQLRMDSFGVNEDDVNNAEMLSPGVFERQAEAYAFHVDEIIQGPAAVARRLAKDAELNEDQLRLVALFVCPMEKKWKEQLRKKPELADATSEVWSTYSRDTPLLVLVGVIVRILFVGGGGCGKSRVINRVLAPLLRSYYGRCGLMVEAQSNKAARNVGGCTLHTANKLMGSSSLITVHLRPKPHQKAAMARNERLGSKLFDELSQLNSKLFHADAYCTAVARANGEKIKRGQDPPVIDATRYADYDQTWGALPVVGIGGDELQLPPVPMQASLFAPIEGTSHEQKAAVKILNSFTHVYRLTTAMRFTDPVLKSILSKMRQPGGCALLDTEWEKLKNTEVTGPDCEKLIGTDLWYEAAYEWSIVCMAQVMRSQLSARHSKTTLFVVQAEDEYMSALDQQHAGLNLNDNRLRRKITHAVLNHPNMNETGRLPGFGMLHIGMTVRITQTTEPGVIVTDSTGKIRGIEFDEREPRQHLEASELHPCPVVVLRYMPVAVYVEMDEIEGVESPRVHLVAPRPCHRHRLEEAHPECSECICGRNLVAVTPLKNSQTWSLEIRLDDGFTVKVKVKRTQLPLVCLQASTLHVLQGCTCDPGLIFHWVFPSRLSRDLKWLAIYVALSRVRSLENLRSVKLTANIKAVIESGPPDSLPAQFAKYFAEKEKKTQVAATEAMETLGWHT